jgi:putative endonuclease
MEKGGCTYIVTNKRNKVLYTGVTSDLCTRIEQHRTKHFPDSFSAKYNLIKLVYFESFYSIEDAIAREKQLKAGSRQKKISLINSINPNWNDLFDEISEW